MKVTINSVVMVFIILCLTLPLSRLGYSAVESFGEINTADNTGTILASSLTELVLSMKIDMSKAEPGEEIKSIEMAIPKGLSIEQKNIKLKIDDKYVSGISPSIQPGNSIIFALTDLVAKTSYIAIEFAVEASPSLSNMDLPFIVIFNTIANNKIILTRDKNVDGISNNDSLALKASRKLGNANVAKSKDSLTLKSTENSENANEPISNDNKISSTYNTKEVLIYVILIVIVIALLIFTVYFIPKILKKRKPDSKKFDIIVESNFKSLPLKDELRYIINEVKYLRLITNKVILNLDKRSFPSFKVKIPLDDIKNIKFVYDNLLLLTKCIPLEPEDFKRLDYSDAYHLNDSMSTITSDFASLMGNVGNIITKLENMPSDASLEQDMQSVDSSLKEELGYIKSIKAMLESVRPKVGSLNLQQQNQQKTSTQEPVTLEDIIEDVIIRLGKVEDWIKKYEQEHPKPINQEHKSRRYSDNLQPKESPLQTFIRLYNEAVDDPNKRGDFNQKYSITRIGVANAMDRRQDPSIEPDFQTSTAGAYIAVKIDGQSNYAVVPRFGTTIDNYLYGPGAAEKIFYCDGYKPNSSYTDVKVIQPAFFDPDTSRQKWTFKEKGKGTLDLG